MSPVRIVFLGGLGEIGRNCACIEVGDRILLLDCGLMFPQIDMPGVDLVLPDFSYLRDQADRLEGVVLTHGHEDHTGGLAYLLDDLDRRLPVLGSALTLGLARSRLEEAGVADLARLRPVADGERLTLGPFDLQFVPVTHSVPHGFATVVRTPVGTVVHSGDFKLDLEPVDGRVTDLALLGAIATEPGGIRLLLSDSTNAEEAGSTASESAAGRWLAELFAGQSERRLVVACFASHLHRVQQIAEAALHAGRRVAFLGRTMIRNVTLAREMGLLDLPSDRVVGIERVAELAPSEVCIICTGSQGEPLSALSLMAAHEHKHVKVGPDDAVVISAHAIPGNESNVARVIDGLHRAGAEVFHEGNAAVHVSGHARREELRLLIRLLAPEWFVPVHGEYRHLVHHATLARESGVEDDHALVLEDGDAITLDEHGAEVEQRAAAAGYLYVDGIVGDIGHGVLRDRRALAEEGIVVVVVTVDATTGAVVAGPEIETKGWVHAAEADELLDEAKAVVVASIAAAAEEGATDFETMRRHARKALSRFIVDRTRRRPAVVPVVVEV